MSPDARATTSAEALNAYLSGEVDSGELLESVTGDTAAIEALVSALDMP